MSVEKLERPTVLAEFIQEFPSIWTRIPYKGFFVASLIAWVLLFEFWGNSTFGYIQTHSLFAWSNWACLSSPDDEHGLIIPFIVLALFWWKRQQFFGINARPWAPGLVLVVVALFLHLVGYLAQQTRISLAAFYFGLYALIGLAWGPTALKKSFFPMCLFAFALPLGTLAETITFPLRLLATKVTSAIAVNGLGIGVIHRGTQILAPDGSFQYEVAAACGGLRSLTAVLALCTIFGFMNFAKIRNRVIMIAVAFPLAIIGNITRLLGIIIVSEAFGQEVGEMVHDNTYYSLVPYIPPILSIVILGNLLKEKAEDDPGSGSGTPQATNPQPAYQI